MGKLPVRAFKDFDTLVTSFFMHSQNPLPPLFLPVIMSSFGWVYPTTHDGFNYVYRIIGKMLSKKGDRLRCLTSRTIFINMNPSY